MAEEGSSALTIDDLAAEAGRRGLNLTRERLAAVLEEVRRLRTHAERLRALPLEPDEPPLFSSTG